MTDHLTRADIHNDLAVARDTKGSTMRATTTKTIPDGDFLNPNVRPPATAMPKAFHALVEEHDKIVAQRHQVQRALRELNQNWIVHEAAAKKADAQAGARAARAGTMLDNPTEHADALRRRKEELENDMATLGDALKLVLHDFYAIRSEEAAKPAYARAVAKAQARMQAAANELRAAAAEAAPVLGVYGWVCDNVAYDGSTALVALEVAPGLAGHIGDANAARTAVSVADIARAVEAFAGLPARTATEKE